jgi:hypothetical protein
LARGNDAWLGGDETRRVVASAPHCCRSLVLSESVELGPDDLFFDLGILGQVSDTVLTADKAIEFGQSACPTPSCPA